MRASIFPIAVVIALAFFGVACTSGGAAPEEEVEETFPAPTVVNPALPVDPANATTSEQLASSDPCGLLDTDTLAAYGEVEIERKSIYPWGCTAHIHGDDTIWEVKLHLEALLSAASDDSEYTSREHDGVTVYSGPFHDIHGCPREVVAAPDAVADIWASSAASEAENCALADVAIERVVAKLLAGDLTPTFMSSDSLAMQDACKLLEPAEVNQVPEIDLSYQSWGYHGESCTWGHPSEGPLVYISFGPFISWLNTLEEEEPVSVGEYEGLIAQGVDTGEDKNTCELVFDYRPLDFPDYFGSTDSVHLVVDAPVEPAEVCELTEALAEAAAGRLA